jgi:hypothetical protein
MSEDLFMMEMENIIDDWATEQLTLSEATKALMRLLWDDCPHEAHEHLRAANEGLFDAQMADAKAAAGAFYLMTRSTAVTEIQRAGTRSRKSC